MANHKSAKKRIRRNQARAEINKSRISRIRTFIKKVESAIGTGDVAAAKLALKEAQPEIMRGVSKGVLHKNTASRKMSRLSASVKKISVNAA
jgi:small subunit ribosomal protein S20